MTLTLTETIFSNFNKRIYGHKREEVRLIAERDEVLIVENAKGIRFTIQKFQVYSPIKPKS